METFTDALAPLLSAQSQPAECIVIQILQLSCCLMLARCIMSLHVAYRYAYLHVHVGDRDICTVLRYFH